MSAPEPAWTPILAGRQRERALEVVTSIASDLQARFGAPSTKAQPDAWSLAGGRSGVALFFAYLSEALADEAARMTAVRLVEDAIEAAAGTAKTYSLYAGFTGIAWTLAHLDGWLLDLTDGDPNEAVDTALLELVAGSPWRGEYDLIGGLVGIGVYALERLPRPTAAECLAAVVARLAELAQPGDRGTSWWTPPDGLQPHVLREFPRGAYNLGVAHGVPGVVALLGKACAVDVVSATARPLLDGAVTWLLAQQLPPDAGASFSSLVAPGVIAKPARSAWCYGDPGAAAALLAAARRAGAPAWEAEALSIAERAAGRPPAECGVADAGVCHGEAGLAHIFNRLYQATGAGVFREAALGWLQRVVDERRPGTGVGGFSAFVPGGDRLADPGFLGGAAGIGLALLAAATPLEPRWDRLLLLS